MTILAEILANKRDEVREWRRMEPESSLCERAHTVTDRASFSSALRSAPMGLIAEVKRRSPSAGAIRVPFDPEAIARAYADAGAHAVSVLMDARYFGGGPGDFRRVRSAVRLPLLYKEFVVDSWQVWHAASIGASAVLLIAAALPGEMLRNLMAVCGEAGLDALVEVHDESELEAALAAGASVIGVNNRDLRTFQTDLATTVRLAARVPPACLLVSESGIRNADDVERVRAAGARAVLVGESLLRAADPASAVRALLQPRG